MKVVVRREVVEVKSLVLTQGDIDTAMREYAERNGYKPGYSSFTWTKGPGGFPNATIPLIHGT